MVMTDYVSAGLVVVAGKYDAQLKWPFAGVATIELLNQLEDKNNDELDMGVAPALQNLPPPPPHIHPELAFNPAQNTQYLKDDKLYSREWM